MDWSDALISGVGALAGATIPGVLSYLGVRTEREKLRDERVRSRQGWWADRDAPVVANVLTLLIDVDPNQRGMNVSPDRSVEQARWDRILERHQEITTQLITMRAGHPSELIRACAGELEVQMAQAVTQTQWLVKDLLENRDLVHQAIAEQSHRAAAETASRLERLVIEYGSSGHGGTGGEAAG